MSIGTRVVLTALAAGLISCGSSSGNKPAPPTPPATGGAGGTSTGGSGGAHASGGSGGTGGSVATGGTGGSLSTGGTGGTVTGGSDGSTADGRAHDGPTVHDAAPAADKGGGDPGAGNTITGTAGGKPFSKIATALWLGKPDPNNGSPVMVVEIFDIAVQCGQITTSGWDAKVGTGNGLEIKVGGDAPGMFHAIGNPAVVAPGEAAVAHTALGANPTENISVSGPVTITAVNAGKNLTGTFDIMLMNGAVQGSFDATFCPMGREP